MDSDQIARLGYLALLLAAFGGWVLVEYRGRIGLALRTAMAWGMIVIGLMAGYGLWQDIRVDLHPRATVLDSGDIRVPRSQDGHFYLTATINGTDIDFLADTGATNIVLTAADARRLGIDPDKLIYLGEARTANGSVPTARITLPDISLGPFRDEGVSAWVNGGEMDISLLGMDYLGRYRIEIDGDEMLLKR